MEFFTPLTPDGSSSLGMALVMSSPTPLILLSDDLVVQAASGSFCRSFALDCDTIVGKAMFELGDGEWDIPQLRSLLAATAAGRAAIDSYEMDFAQEGLAPRTLILNAHFIDLANDSLPRIVLAITDITAVRESERHAREAERDKEALVRERQVLLHELNHRVANSLQIIASILMQRVRSVQSEETRAHLRDAHHRVMSIATLQRQLASTESGDVCLRPYLTELCASIGASMISDPVAVTLTVEVDDSATSADRSVSIGLIVTELVINALKHAFPEDSYRGAIKVLFAATPPGWQLTVADDGAGLPSDYANAKPGLGTGIVNALATPAVGDSRHVGRIPGTIVTVSGADLESAAA